MAPLSMYTYPSLAASCRASVLLPQDDHPSIVTMMGAAPSFVYAMAQKCA
jgi:hypothetical protein